MYLSGVGEGMARVGEGFDHKPILVAARSFSLFLKPNRIFLPKSSNCDTIEKITKLIFRFPDLILIVCSVVFLKKGLFTA